MWISDIMGLNAICGYLHFKSQRYMWISAYLLFGEDNGQFGVIWHFGSNAKIKHLLVFVIAYLLVFNFQPHFLLVYHTGNSKFWGCVSEMAQTKICDLP